MQSDPYVRAILTIIALCLLVLVAQGYGLGREEPAPAPVQGQWSLQMMRTGLGGAPTLLRMNTATGELWHTKFGANQEWALVGGAEEETVPEPPAPPPAPAPEAPPAPAPEAPPQP
jgi:hypothetical protein